MSRILPTDFMGVSVSPTLITARNSIVPAFGGPEQRRNRMGSRYSLKVQLEPMAPMDADEWADLDDETETCVLVIPQPGIDVGVPGSPIVAGAGQAGANLAVSGLTPHYIVRKHQWLTVETGGQLFCYRARDYVVAAADGTATIALKTMLRKPPADGDTVDLAVPRIEGFVTLDADAWKVDGNHLISLAFEIKERE